MKHIKQLFLTALLAVLGAASAWAQPSGGGSGTSGDPYRIGTAADLKAFAEYVNDGNWTSCAQLTADIDLSGVCGESLGNWVGIGTMGYPYRGTFDGQGHTISGLYINATDGYYYGLFRRVYEAHISHLKLAGNLTVTNESGILIGKSETPSDLVEDVEILSGSSITGGSYLGGIVGNAANGTFTRCINRATVTSNSSNSAGIAGSLVTGRLTHCVNYGLITSTSYHGAGIVGQMAVATISGCANYGDVHGKFETGGLVGYSNNNSGVIENCLQAGNVTGYSGGGIAYSTYAAIRNCLQMGNVTLDDQRAGFIAAYVENLTDYTGNCYLATATFNYMNKADDPSRLSFVNSALASVTTALTAADLSSGKAAFLLQGDQATTCWTQTLGSDDLPTPLSESGSKVYLNGTIACDGTMTGTYSNTLTSGTTRQDHDYDANGLCTRCGDGEAPALVGAKYQIATVGNLLWLRDEINLHRTQDLKVQQTADLDLSLVCGPALGNWLPIADQRVTSNNGAWHLDYDGQGHTISGLYIDDPDDSSETHGLFGILYSSSVSHLHLSGCHVNLPKASYVGALLGNSSTSSVTDVTLDESSTVVGNQYVGGIVGNCYGTVTSCTNHATVKGKQDVGGIVGYLGDSRSVVSLCFSDGTIQAVDVSTGDYTPSTKNAGGICGSCNGATITRCESAGTVNAYSKAAGICGDMMNDCIVSDCASSGTITAYEQVAGISAWVYGTVANCLFTGTVSQYGSIASQHGLIVAWTNTPARVTDCFYSADCKISNSKGSEEPAACYADDLAGAQSVSHDVLVSGEVAFKLQGVRSDVIWSQGLDGKNLPTVIFDPADPHRVYLFTGTADCAGNLKTPATYANSVGPSAQYLDHVYGADGVCTVCHKLQQPDLIDGVYHIGNYGQLATFRDLVNGGNTTANAVLTADIDLTPFCGEDKGNFDFFQDFQGSFDGQGHKISGFYYDYQNATTTPDNFGLFGLAGNTSAETEICNLELEGYIDTRSRYRAALLVGQSRGQLAIHHVTTRGTVKGQGSTAGIVGYMTGGTTINDCTNYASVSGGTNSGQGGIVGQLFSSRELTMTNLANYGTINGLDLVGGIVGYKQDAQKLTLKNVANYSAVSAGSRVAGITGTKNTEITVDGAYVSSNITASSGAVGIIMPNADVSSNITRAFYDASHTLTTNGSPINISGSADVGKATAVSRVDVVAGRAAYLLGEGFGQQLPGGTEPVIGGPRVYYGRYQHAVAEPIFPEDRYTNILVGLTPSTHNFVAGVCTICGKHNGEVYAGVNKTFPDWKSTNQGQDNTTDTSDKDLYDLGSVAVGATLSFVWHVDSEKKYDTFSAYVMYYDDDATEVVKLVSGQSGATGGTVNYTFEESGHFFLKLWYRKDSSQSNGADMAWVNNIKYVNLSLVPGEVWADLNGDGNFDLDDISAIRSMILHPTTADAKADLNEDGEVTIGDVTEGIHQLIMP